MWQLRCLTQAALGVLLSEQLQGYREMHNPLCGEGRSRAQLLFDLQQERTFGPGELDIFWVSLKNTEPLDMSCMSF